MGTSLQFLHQNLYELKNSKLMDNELFKELYYEAKGHEKNASLYSLAAKNKNDKLSQETNFYLILTRMLNELRESNMMDLEFRGNLDKIHKWYLKNKQLFLSSKANNKAEIANKQNRIFATVEKKEEPSSNLRNAGNNSTSSRVNLTSRTGVSSEEPDINIETSGPKFSIRPSRDLSPINFPSLSRSKNESQNSQRTDRILSRRSVSKQRLHNEGKALPNSKPFMKLTDATKTLDSNNTQNTHRSNDIENKVKQKMDDASREEILKALSVYADQIYANLDQNDTKKLEIHLRSLSKFYNTLNEYQNSPVPKNPKLERETSVTMQSLIEVAKEVSDRMIISKAHMNMRIKENKLLLESYAAARKEIVEQEAAEKLEKLSLESDTEQINGPIYSITVKNPSRRPKSTSYTDWRGQISRPQTERKKSKSALKLHVSSTSPSRPKTSASNSQTEVHDEKEKSEEVKIEEDKSKPDEETKEDNKDQVKQRPKSLIRSAKQQTREINSASTENKDLKFVSFVKKIEELPRDDKSSTKEEVKSEKSEEKSALPAPSEIKEEEKSIENKTTSDDKEISESNTTSKIFKCLHNEITMCECCKYPQTPRPTFIQNNDDEIFHLTSTGVEVENQKPLSKSTLPKKSNIASTATQSQHLGLREILIANYDPKFASKIGIHDFIPIQVMTSSLNGEMKDLEFIPFENIDSSYPKVQGCPVFDPNSNKSQRKLYRTNPSIPRPESKYGTRSTVYEQIIELKRQNLDTDALDVWQPEDVHLVKDLLDLEHEPLKEVLKVEGLKPDLKNEEGENNQIEKTDKPVEPKQIVNTQITPMGRPVNVHVYTRWKPIEEVPKEATEQKPEKLDFPEPETDWIKMEREKSNFAEQSTANLSSRTKETNFSDVTPRPRLPQFKILGNSFSANRLDYMSEGRPIPIEKIIHDPVKEADEFNKFNEVKKSVHIPSIFKGSNISRNLFRDLNPEERFRREDERKAALTIQKNYRKHLQEKKIIENRPSISTDTLEWAINYRNELIKRKLEKEKAAMEEKMRIEKENARLKATIKKIGVHIDLYQILHAKGPEYTNQVLDKAATCIQKWLKGWLVRKELKKLKNIITNDGYSWSSFTKRYRKTILRILKMRGSYRNEFDFIPSEALEFYLKEKKYSSFFEKLAFMSEIDLCDVERMFNFVDLYPNKDEIADAKINVLKFNEKLKDYKKKANSTSIPKRAMFDIIYYIYPPPATKLKSTRKSTWLNPIVDGEDALRLKGSKIVEPTMFEKSWKLVRDHSFNERSLINKNTPVPHGEEEEEEE